MNINEMEKKLREICDVEGLIKEKMKEHPKFEFAFKLQYPPWHPHPKHVIAVVPKNKHYVSIELATKISPKHLDTFNKMKEQGMDFLPLFFHLLRNMLISRSLFYNFNIKNHSYIINDHIYSDGLNMDNFYRRIRHVYYASLAAQGIINDIVSGKFKGLRMLPKLGESEESASPSSEDLFYS
jgi:hypothetical protein